MKTRAILLFTFLFCTSPAWAYYGVLDNGEILADGHYKLTGDLQALTDNGGLNLGTRFDIGFQQEYGVRAIFGTGKTDLFFGGLFKWMPFPDIEGGQPAIGFNTGLLYAREGDTRDLTVRFEPLVSKKFKFDSTTWTPYASLPVGIRMSDHDGGAKSSYLAWQLVAGTQLALAQFKSLEFIGEVGANLESALGHVSVGLVYAFDRGNGSN